MNRFLSFLERVSVGRALNVFGLLVFHGNIAVILKAISMRAIGLNLALSSRTSVILLEVIGCHSFVDGDSLTLIAAHQIVSNWSPLII